jgi:hypothetical protein
MLALSRDPPSRRPQLQTPKKIRDFQLVPALDVAQTRQRRRRSPKAEGGFWDVPHDGEVCCACAFFHLLSYPVPRAALLADHRSSRAISSHHLTSPHLARRLPRQSTRIGSSTETTWQATAPAAGEGLATAEATGKRSRYISQVRPAHLSVSLTANER